MKPNKTKFKQTEIGMIPEDWEVKKISDLFNVFAGGDLSKLTFSKNKDKDYKYPIYSNSLNDKGLYGFSKTYKYEPECITVTGRGDVGRAECRREPFNAIVRLLVLKPKEKLSCYFIASFINSKLDFQIVGSAVNQLTAPMISEFVVAFPLLPEQSAIAKILSDLDAKIELNQQMNKTLEEIGKAIFKHWFVDFEFPNDEGKPYKSSGGEMEYNEELGKEIPKGWRVGRLGDNNLTKICQSGIDKFEGEKIYLDTASVQNSTIINLEEKIKFYNKPSRANMQPKPKTVWFARMKESKKTIFFDDYFDYGLDNFILSTGFAGLETKSYCLYYIYTFIINESFEREKNNLCHGTTMQAINNENIKNIKILIPDMKTLNKFEQVSKNLYKKSINIFINNLTLSSIRDALLPKLMSGKIRVPIEEKL